MSDDVKNFAKEISEAQGDRLIQAAGTGDLQTVTALVEAGMDPNWHREYSAETALRAAARAGHIEVVEFLLNHGAEVDFSIENSNTALVEASKARQWDVAQILLDHGADPLRRDETDFRTCPWIAASAWQDFLLDHGGDPLLKSESDGLTPVWMEATEEQIFIITSMFEKAPDYVDRDQIIQEVLLGASFGGDSGMVWYALARRAEVNGKGSYLGETALMEAARAGNAEVIRLLLELGADIHLQDESGNTALSWAVRSDSITAVQLLIDAGSHT